MRFDVCGQNAEINFLDDTTVDVFLGDGWDNWTRFNVKRVKGKVFLTKTHGKAVKSEEFKELCSHLQ